MIALNDKQQRAFDRWQEAYGSVLRIGAQHQMANGGFGTATARQAAREIDRASDPELDRSMIPLVFLGLWNARRAEAIGMEYTR